MGAAPERHAAYDAALAPFRQVAGDGGMGIGIVPPEMSLPAELAYQPGTSAQLSAAWRGADDERIPDEWAGAVFPGSAERYAWSAARQDGKPGLWETLPMPLRRREADFAVLPRRSGERIAPHAGAFPRGLMTREWKQEAPVTRDAWQFAAAGRDGQAEITPARPALPLFPTPGNLALPQPAAPLPAQPPIQLEVTVKAGRDFTAEADTNRGPAYRVGRAAGVAAGESIAGGVSHI